MKTNSFIRVQKYFLLFSVILEGTMVLVRIEIWLIVRGAFLLPISERVLSILASYKGGCVCVVEFIHHFFSGSLKYV